MTWVETAVHFRHFVEMSAIVSCISHAVQKHIRAGKVILLNNLPAIMQWVLLVDFQVGDGDPFAQLLQKLRT
jgi:hypothetical protein